MCPLILLSDVLPVGHTDMKLFSLRDLVLIEEPTNVDLAHLLAARGG